MSLYVTSWPLDRRDATCERTVPTRPTRSSMGRLWRKRHRVIVRPHRRRGPTSPWPELPPHRPSPRDQPSKRLAICHVRLLKSTIPAGSTLGQDRCRLSWKTISPSVSVGELTRCASHCKPSERDPESPSVQNKAIANQSRRPGDRKLSAIWQNTASRHPSAYSLRGRRRRRTLELVLPGRGESADQDGRAHLAAELEPSRDGNKKIATVPR